VAPRGLARRAGAAQAAQEPLIGPPTAIRRRPALLALAALAVAACDRRGAGERDQETARPGSRRVISLSPSTTEAVFAVGAGANLVGRSRYCDYPPEASGLPAVGGYADPSVEAVLGLSPTLVVGARGPAGPALEQALRARGIETYFPETESMAQIEEMLAELGRRLGADAGASRAIARIRARRKAVESAFQGRPRVRAALLFDTGPIVAAGPGSFPDELIRLAGGDNVIARGGAYPTLSVEHLLALDPDVLVDGAAEVHEGAAPGASRLAALRDAPGWRELRAMREGRVRLLGSAAALRPGPRIGEGLAALARALHGDGVEIKEGTP
jgi:iron complex transport system substrate-binding protein